MDKHKHNNSEEDQRQRWEQDHQPANSKLATENPNGNRRTPQLNLEVASRKSGVNKARRKRGFRAAEFIPTEASSSSETQRGAEATSPCRCALFHEHVAQQVSRTLYRCTGHNLFFLVGDVAGSNDAADVEGEGNEVRRDLGSRAWSEEVEVEERSQLADEDDGGELAVMASDGNELLFAGGAFGEQNKD